MPATRLYRNYAAAAAGGKCDNGGLADCHCQCGAGHDNPPGAVVDVRAKVAPACNGQKACKFPVCWATGAGQPEACEKPGAVALGDPCLRCKKDFQIVYNCTWGWSFILAAVLCGGLYAGGGWILNHRLKNLNGVDALPHKDRWKELMGLVQDGVRFTQARINGRRGYAAVREEHSETRAAKSVSDRSHGKNGAGREFGTATGRKSKSRKDSKQRSKPPDATEFLPESESSDASRATEAESKAKSTPSGTGGRWVHVPS